MSQENVPSCPSSSGHVLGNIWTRWIKEFLPVHNICQNWYKERPHWKKWSGMDYRPWWRFYRLGRIKRCQFGNDGNIQSCDVLKQSGLISYPTSKLSCVVDDIGCVPLQEKHRAGNEKAWKWATEKNPKIGSFNEPYFHIVWQNDFRIGGNRHFLRYLEQKNRKLTRFF